jgi:hypothetical protein
MRPGLTRDRIVEAAIALVDEGGPDALTMRAVAQRLGAGAMSLTARERARGAGPRAGDGASATPPPATGAPTRGVARDVRQAPAADGC